MGTNRRPTSLDVALLVAIPEIVRVEASMVALLDDDEREGGVVVGVDRSTGLQSNATLQLLGNDCQAALRSNATLQLLGTGSSRATATLRIQRTGNAFSPFLTISQGAFLLDRISSFPSFSIAHCTESAVKSFFDHRVLFRDHFFKAA
jgi:hypothetical protein